METSQRRKGPDLASDAAVLTSPERWRRALGEDIGKRWARSRALLFAAVYVAWAVLCVALWNAGYPAWRVVALAASLCALVVVQVSGLRSDGPWLDGESLAFFILFAAAAATGGVHSPLLIGLTGQLTGFLIRRGWTRGTRVVLAGLAAITVALGAVPARWTGPQIPDPIFTITVVVVVLAAAGIHTDYLLVVMRAAGEALRQLLRARDERAAEALARAAELERMSSHLSHELKNPLGAIKALVQLSVRGERDPDIRARLEVVAGEVDRMQSILQGYLSFSRPLDALHPELVELGALADEVNAILDGRADAGRVALRRAGDAAITGDPRRLKQALLNLVANAIEATPPGGHVEVRLAATPEGARIEVRDTGRGMAPDVLERVGTPFFTTRDAGTGLGVSLARGVFVQHGGRLEYASTPGRGTVATATLPTTCKEGAVDATCAARG
ncbi:sensor histidine kinase [Anaeromyxobacter oryzisoli]|uniref:sensor histidine kinase n=1 Tax=Anaeromyxobacter oryzisoli TaxID=2925408 RepID=UPI001F5969D8|nr:HAMP domain-containing sensor histidine kinase [Anaeromyxobacter sp. SG63]